MQSILKGIGIVVYRLRHQGIITTAKWIYGRGMPKLTGVPLKSNSEITPKIYVGPQYKKSALSWLSKQGIHACVNMRFEFDDALHGLALEQYLHLPTIDDDAPTLEQLQKGIDFITKIVQDGGKVYIHCKGGIGRAPTMAAAYFLSTGMSLDDAVALIEKRRPFIRIMPPQWERLRELETQFQQSPPKAEAQIIN